MNRPEFKQDVNELYAFYRELLAESINDQHYGIEWLIFDVELALDRLNHYIENHPKTKQL